MQHGVALAENEIYQLELESPLLTLKFAHLRFLFPNSQEANLL